MGLPPYGPEPYASANSATPACLSTCVNSKSYNTRAYAETQGIIFNSALVIFGADLKVLAAVSAHRAHLGRFGADVDVAAVAALPHVHVVALEHLARVDALDQLAVALLVLLLNRSDAVEQLGEGIEAPPRARSSPSRRTSGSTLRSRRQPHRADWSRCRAQPRRAVP